MVSRRLRAPEQNGGVVAEPPLTEAGRWLAANRQRFASSTFAILGRSVSDLRREACRTAVQAARSYLEKAGEPLPNFSAVSLLLVGHQPELFHPGVWVKNFALHSLAQAYGATPVNLIVDSDTAKSTALRLPTTQPQVVHLPFDHWSGEMPYEERPVNDEVLFASLPQRAAPIWKDWGFVPLLSSFWEEARRQAVRTRLLGERLVAARRAFERRWGCHNLELPVSLLCQTEPFGWFVCHLLAELPRFHAAYNTCLHAYRRLYGIRSRNHPVPDLTREGDWLEVPFWAWRAGPNQRERLMARQTTGAVELRAGNELWPRLPLRRDSNTMVLAWRELEHQGLKIRSRALTNTLFARLFLADLFIHGIGGGKYDELTDEIIRRFYEMEPPGYLVLSATLLLPFAPLPARPELRRHLARQLRDLHYNPQRHLGPDALAQPAIADRLSERKAWLEKNPKHAQERRERFEKLRRITDQLRPYVRDQQAAVHQELNQCDRQLEANAVLQQRDFPFCLYPEELVRPFVTRFLGYHGESGLANE